MAWKSVIGPIFVCQILIGCIVGPAVVLRSQFGNTGIVVLIVALVAVIGSYILSLFLLRARGYREDSAHRLQRLLLIYLIAAPFISTIIMASALQDDARSFATNVINVLF
ncbi:MAG: hypothetical protein ACR2OW_08915 [Methyloligellaceae bacterium]